MAFIFSLILCFGGPHVDIHIPGAEEIQKEVEKETEKPKVPVQDSSGNITWVNGV